MLSTLAGLFNTAQRLLGRSFRAWSDWARKNPGAAAHQLELVAGMLEHRADARRKPQGWFARRDRALALALRDHAAALKDEARQDAACATRPGTWGASG